MPFWDRLLRLFRPAGKPAPKKPMTSAKVPLPKPVPGLSRHPLQYLFSEDQYTCTMLNSITLSSDMKTLYLIDNGRAIPFDLTAPEGVLVGLLGDQLTAATAAPQPAPTPVGDTEEELPREGLVAARSATPTKATFKATEKSQYTVVYNPAAKALGIIGVDDFIVRLQTPDNNNCRSVVFSLDDAKVLHFKYKDKLLTISTKS
ncbi:MAG: hypothetical protein D6772_02815 [Bacteroidetes bacterium]|nr:MAG: hypothetical protein D6772_02815 [Bacteroidota bacterium]